MTRFELEHLTIHGHDVAFRAGGSGPAVLLVHGMAGSSTTWRYTMPQLAERAGRPAARGSHRDPDPRTVPQAGRRRPAGSRRCFAPALPAPARAARRRRTVVARGDRKLWPLLVGDVNVLVLHVFTAETMPRILDRPGRDMGLLGDGVIPLAVTGKESSP